MMEKLELKKIIIRHTYMVRAIMLIIASLSIAIFMLLPMYESASSNVRKIRTRKTEEKALTDKVAVLSTLDDRQLTERVATLDSALPPKKDVVLYLSTVAGLSQELNLVFGGVSLSPGEVTEATMAAQTKNKKSELGLSTLETDLKIVGSRESIYTFLRLIEETAPLMQIKDVKVSNLAGESYSLSLKLGMLWAERDNREVKGAITLFNDQEEKYFRDLSAFRRFTDRATIPGSSTGVVNQNIFEAPISLP